MMNENPSKILEVEELKKIKATIKPPEERFKAWEQLLKDMFLLEMQMIDVCLFDEIKAPKHLKDKLEQDGIRSLQENLVSRRNEFEEKIKFYTDKFDAIKVRLFSSIRAYDKYIYYYEFLFQTKALFDSDYEEMKEKVKVEAVNIYTNAQEKRPQDVTKFINDSKSMLTVFLFQSPRRTSSDAMEREIMHNIYSHWDANYFVVECCLLVNKLFENYK